MKAHEGVDRSGIVVVDFVEGGDQIRKPSKSGW